MPSIFDRVQAINSNYVPQFVGSNYKELSEAAGTLDERYRRNLDLTNKVAIMMSQDKYLEGDKAIKEKMAQQVYGGIEDISSSDKNFENSTAAVSALARDYYTNEQRIAALDNYQKVQQAKDLRTKLGANFLNFGDNPDTFSTVHPDTGEIQRYEPKIEERADYSRKMQELLGKVADDGYTISPTGQKIVYDDNTRYLIKSGQINKISPDKLNDLVEGLLPVYKSTGEGQQDLRRLTNILGLKEEPITVKDGKRVRQTTNLDEDIRNRFRALAAPQAFNKSAQRWDDFGLPVNSGKVPPGGGGVFTGNTPGSITDNTSLNTDTITKDRDVVNGFKYVNKTTGETLSADSNPLNSGTTDAYAVEDLLNNYDKVPVDRNAEETALNNEFIRINNQLPQGVAEYKGIDDYKASKEAAIENHKKITPTGNVIAPAQAEQYDDMISRQVVSSPMYFKEGGKPVIGLEGLAKQIGTSPSKIKFKAVNTFYDSPRADLPGGYIEAKIEVVGDDKVKNHPTSVFIPLNNQFQALAAPIDHLYKNSFYAGKDTYTEEHPYIPTIPDANGNQVPFTNPQGQALTFYTVTFPIPKDQQKAGQPGFKTMVYPGTLSSNGSGGQDVNWSSTPMQIGTWKQFMSKTMEGLFQNALNSGQTFNTEDYKKQGVQY